MPLADTRPHAYVQCRAKDLPLRLDVVIDDAHLLDVRVPDGVI